MTETLVFLQNAWSPLYAGGAWPRTSWLRALERSQSGKRLRLLVDDLSCCYNTTPVVGERPSSVVPPSPDYVGEILADHEPRAVVACGRQAEGVLLELWAGPLLIVPHPAWRLLQNRVYLRGREVLERGLADRMALRSPRRDEILEEYDL